jgi:hypothetical protein
MNIALYLFWRVRVPPEFKNWKNTINPIYKAADKKGYLIEQPHFL